MIKSDIKYILRSLLNYFDTKIRVAEALGITRKTLDAWINEAGIHKDGVSFAVKYDSGEREPVGKFYVRDLHKIGSIILQNEKGEKAVYKKGGVS